MGQALVIALAIFSFVTGCNLTTFINSQNYVGNADICSIAVQRIAATRATRTFDYPVAT